MTAQAPARLRTETLLARDAHRLLQRQRALKAGDGAGLAAWQQAVTASQEKVKARIASVPALDIDEQLPIAAHAQTIIDTIAKHQVVVIAGATGSGKTTQLPKLCLAAGRGSRGLIGVTQPRRLAARTIARRLSEEMRCELGGLVGWQVRFTDQVREESLIKVMTDGILLAETRGDAYLNRYDTIVLDEAHERSQNVDFLLGYFKQLLAKRRDLKLIVTSATIDTDRFSEHFGGAPVLTVEGRGFPVDIRYRPPDVDMRASADERGDATEAALLSAIAELSGVDPRGDMLVFLPGEREIRDVHRLIEKQKLAHTEVLALYARLSGAEQDRVFNPGPKRRIVLATNVAETSITVPRIRFVIDFGTARLSRYSPRTQVQRLHIEPISQAAADQRAGRCGRLSAGVCIRLYEEAEFRTRPAFTDPEILRSALAGVVLTMLDLKLGDPLHFPFLDPLDPRQVREGYALLTELGAIDRDRHLTPIGRQMARLPVDVRYARMLIAGAETGALRELLVLVAGLSIQDPRERPHDRREAADQAHAILCKAESSDFLGLLALWEAYRFQSDELSQSALRSWAKANFLSAMRLREWRELHRQLLLLARDELRLPVNTDVATPEAVHRAVLSGLLGHIGVKDDKQLYLSARGRKFQIFPGSSVARSSPKWVMAAILLDTQKLYALTVAKIDPAWVEPLALHLVHRRHYDPFWDPRAGRVFGFEDVTLYGVPIASRRRISFEAIEPAECRQLFLRHALVRGDIEARHALFHHNDQVREEAKAKEEKLRRRGLLKDELQLVDWFAERLPVEVVSVPAFLRYWKDASGAERERLRLHINDLVLPLPDETLDLYPDTLLVGGQPLSLQYTFDPAQAVDGVSAQVSLHQLAALPAHFGDWLVPGLLQEKLVCLIKGLPKTLRRHVVPAPDFASAFLEGAPARDGPVVDALAKFLQRASGVEISPRDFADIELPAHLILHIAVVDQGQILAQGDNLVALKAQFAEQARAAFAEQVDAVYHRDGLKDWPTFDLPDEVKAKDGQVAFPTLVAGPTGIDLRALSDRDEAAALHGPAVLALLRLSFGDIWRHWQRHLPLSTKALMAYTPIDTAEALRADILETVYRDEFAERASTVRRASEFVQLKAEVHRGLGTSAAATARIVEEILLSAADLRRALQPKIVGYARANYDDALAQLGRLVFPQFARHTPLTQLRQYPRYLRALSIRAEKIARDASRDQARMLDVLPFEQDWLRLQQAGTDAATLQALRWQIEEFRISLFAQEVGTPEPISAKRLKQRFAGAGA